MPEGNCNARRIGQQPQHVEGGLQIADFLWQASALPTQILKQRSELGGGFRVFGISLYQLSEFIGK